MDVYMDRTTIIVGIVAALLGVLGNSYVTYQEGQNARTLERQQFESSLIRDAIKSGTPEEVSKKLRFYSDMGLIEEKKERIEEFLFYKDRIPHSDKEKQDPNTIALMEAIERGDNKKIQDLLENESIDVNFQDYWGDTPLILAAKKGLEKTVKDLLKKNANMDAQDKNGLTALLWADLKKFTKITAQLKSVSDTKIMPEWHAGPDENTNWNKAYKWVKTLGGDWRMPSKTQLINVYKKGLQPKTTGWGIWSRNTKGSYAWMFHTDNVHHGWRKLTDNRHKRAFAVCFPETEDCPPPKAAKR